MMLRTTLVAFALLLIPSFSSATRFLPRGQYADTPSKAFQELRDVMVHPRNRYPVELPPRLYFPAKKPMPRASNPQDSAAAVKRTLLGKRQTCSAGYGYCYPAIAAPTAAAPEDVAPMARASTAKRRPAVYTAATATTAPNAAAPTRAAATPATSAAGTGAVGSARPTAANAV
ncbi:MAG: hypothetical protein Q9210_007493 [Variospora velana]